MNDLKELKMIIKYLFLNSRTINETNTEMKNYMDESSFAILGPLLNTTLELVKEAKAASLNKANYKKMGIEMDDIDIEAIKNEVAKICSASTYVMEVSGQMVLNFGPLAANMVKTNFMTYFALNLNNYKNISESELLDATCFFCDLVEYAYHSDESMISELNAKFMEIFAWTDSMDVKQTLSYGLGVFSMFITPNNYKAVLKNTVTLVMSMIKAADAFEEDNVVATETAIGALGKMIYFQRDGQIINEDVVNMFISKLPLKNEEEEATKSHLFFCE